jgi:hypothetical protein
MTFEFADLTDADHLRMHLSYGHHTAQTKAKLAEATGIHPRDVEETLRQMTFAGEPIVSDGTGYWLGTDEEIEQYVERLRGRLITQYRRIRALRHVLAAHRRFQQTTLWRDAA